MIPADSTVIHHNIPCPKSYRVPLQIISLIHSRRVQGLWTFLTSNLFLPSELASAPPDFDDLTPGAFDLAGAEGPASGISTSAMAIECEAEAGFEQIADEYYRVLVANSIAMIRELLIFMVMREVF